jgi:putative ATPase
MALQVAVAALHAVQFLGLPEGRLALTQAAVYLAAAPKSNAVCRAIDSASALVRAAPQYAVPLHLRPASTPLGQSLGHGAGYVYAHDVPAGVAPMCCLPPEIADKTFFTPGERGFEKKIAERMADNDRHRHGDR